MGTVPAPHTWTAGDNALSSYLQSLTDGILYDLGVATSGGSKRPKAAIRQTVAQTIATAAYTALLFDTNDVDSDGGHSTVTNTDRYTAQTAGWYRLSGGTSLAGNVTGRRLTKWQVNGVDVSGGQLSYVPDGNTADFAFRTKLVFLNLGDYVQAWVYQASGGNLATGVAVDDQSALTVEWVSE